MPSPGYGGGMMPPQGYGSGFGYGYAGMPNPGGYGSGYGGMPNQVTTSQLFSSASCREDTPLGLHSKRPR